MKNESVSTLIKVAADLAARRPLHAIDALCDNQKQVSSARLYDMVEASGDTLAAYAVEIRQAADALTAQRANFMRFLDQLSYDIDQHGPRSLAALIESQLEELKK